MPYFHVCNVSSMRYPFARMQVVMTALLCCFAALLWVGAQASGDTESSFEAMTGSAALRVVNSAVGEIFS